jgi:hypothetical protein
VKAESSQHYSKTLEVIQCTRKPIGLQKINEKEKQCDGFLPFGTNGAVILGNQWRIDDLM